MTLSDEQDNVIISKNNLQDSLQILIETIFKLTQKSSTIHDDLLDKYKTYLSKRNKKQKKHKEEEYDEPEEPPQELPKWRKTMKYFTGYSGFRW